MHVFDMNSGDYQCDICISCTILHVMFCFRDYVYPAVVWWTLTDRDREQLSCAVIMAGSGTVMCFTSLISLFVLRGS